MFKISKLSILSLRKLAFLCAALLFFAAPGVVLASKSNLVDVVKSQKDGEIVYVTLGKAELVDVAGDISDVLVANPSIVDVMAVQSNRLYLVGVSIGDTNLIALDANGDVLKKLDVHVKYDLAAIQGLVESLFPGEDVTVGAVHDQVILTGTVSSPDVATKVADVIDHYVGSIQGAGSADGELVSSLLEVRGEQQVMLQVKIVEASRTVLKELGVESNFNDTTNSTASFFGNTIGTSQYGSATASNPAQALFSTGAGIALSQDPTGSLGLLFDSGINGIGALGLFLNALEEEDLVNILAEPNLTAVSGEQAGFLAGGEFPIPTGRDQTGNIVIDYREFGVSLNFRPIVLSDDRISLQMNTEVSSLDFSNAVVLADLTVPGLDIRRAETTVEIPSGGSLMIAGLLKSEAIQGMSGLPGVMDTPILGDLVSSDSFQREETELLVIVTPYLVEPYEEKQRADRLPPEERHGNPLASAFAMNLRRAFEVEDDELFASDNKYGYLLD